MIAGGEADSLHKPDSYGRQPLEQAASHTGYHVQLSFQRWTLQKSLDFWGHTVDCVTHTLSTVQQHSANHLSTARAAAAASSRSATAAAAKSRKHHQTSTFHAPVVGTDLPNHNGKSLVRRGPPWRALPRVDPHPPLGAARMDPHHLLIGAPGALLRPPF